LIGAMTATWLLLVTGAAGRVVLFVEELTHPRRVPSVSAPQADPSGATIPARRREVTRGTTCLRAENVAPQRVRRHQPEAATTQADLLGTCRDHLWPVSSTSPRDHRLRFAMRPLRPLGHLPRDETGVVRRHRWGRRSPDDEDMVLVTPHPRLRHRPSPARIAHLARSGRFASRYA
jgi:hypothetical protein